MEIFKQKKIYYAHQTGKLFVVLWMMYLFRIYHNNNFFFFNITNAKNVFTIMILCLLCCLMFDIILMQIQIYSILYYEKNDKLKYKNQK